MLSIAASSLFTLFAGLSACTASVPCTALFSLPPASEIFLSIDAIEGAFLNAYHIQKSHLKAYSFIGGKPEIILKINGNPVNNAQLLIIEITSYFFQKLHLVFGKA